jgi:hypothetical protein
MTGIDRWAVAASGCDASDAIINLMKSRRIMGFIPVPRSTPNVEPYHSSKRSGLHVHGKFADVRSGQERKSVEGLLDHLVGDGEQIRRDSEANCPHCLEVDDQLELGR